MQYLDNLTEEIGRASDDRTPAHEMLAQHEVGRFLKQQGYRYYHIGSWFNPTASIPIADENLSFDTTSEFESVLRDTTILPALEEVLGRQTPETTFRDRHREGTLFTFRQLHRLQSAPGPKFVFAHVLLPHDPYVFHADGSVIPEAEAKAGEEAGLYRGQLEFANANIKSIVDELLAGPDAEDPIVIVQADEGPLFCRNVDCPQLTEEYAAIRFGILNAIRCSAATLIARSSRRSTPRSASASSMPCTCRASTGACPRPSRRSTRSGRSSASTSGPTCRTCRTTATRGRTTSTSTTSTT